MTQTMDLHSIVNFAASSTTIVAATLIASNYSPRVMVAGFVIFVMASVLWIASGHIGETPSLIIQNVVLLLINIVGIWRWLPRT